jgi:hypothetical protein
MLSAILIYSTKVHLDQLAIIETPIARKYEIGVKRQSICRRGIRLLSCLWGLSTTFSAAIIYIPRSGAKDNWLVYRLFRNRCILISDGLSDLLEYLPVFQAGRIKIGFGVPVDVRFHVAMRDLPKRKVMYDPEGPVAVYNKRGRDPDYVQDFAGRMSRGGVVVNPAFGYFSRIYSAPSTVLFELPICLKCNIEVVSEKHCDSLSSERRALLAAYEVALGRLGFKIV